MLEATAAHPIVLYDGSCGLCHKSVKWLLRREADGELRYAPLQGDTAAALRARHPTIPTTLESVVLVDGDRVFLRSKVFLQAARHLRAPWRWAYHFRWFPAFVLDLGYRLVARLRYRIWGRADVCDLPSPDKRARFLP
ncbi:MAG: DCC1-like thiol-disulfide oxidoreductase family protein [Proteobacteria bacterium]|nr:DCC1-like thiol-disulfide oxidoreductase family protein [Pseudomonadota bacterium]